MNDDDDIRDALLDKWLPVFDRHGFHSDAHAIDFSYVKEEVIEAMGKALLALEAPPLPPAQVEKARGMQAATAQMRLRLRDAIAEAAGKDDKNGLLEAFDLVTKDLNSWADQILTEATQVSEVTWIVNQDGEFGVRVGSQNFWYYKWPTATACKENLPPEDAEARWRPVHKREFGETIKASHLGPFDGARRTR